MLCRGFCIVFVILIPCQSATASAGETARGDTAEGRRRRRRLQREVKKLKKKKYSQNEDDDTRSGYQKIPSDDGSQFSLGGVQSISSTRRRAAEKSSREEMSFKQRK